MQVAAPETDARPDRPPHGREIDFREADAAMIEEALMRLLDRPRQQREAEPSARKARTPFAGM